ncbi:hypothetical protein LTR17_022905 [Elasticomyces elasticus]|nr:hypothetical protein LTR17_022905 [Elasticomyces elasticus]
MSAQPGDKAQEGANEIRDGASKIAQGGKEKLQEGQEKAKREAEQAKRETQEKLQQGKEKAEEVKNTFVQKLREDGVVNPQGLATAGFGALFLAAVPLTSWITQSNGLVEKAVNGVCHSVAYIGSAGSQSGTSQTGKIAALSTLYVAMTYALSGAGSAAGLDAGTEEGRDNNHPRRQVQGLTGLPLRLHSAHYNLMEMFGGFGLTAALAQAMAPGDQSLINLLGLHVISKVFVYYPAYLFNYGAPRTVAHILATASV